MITGGDCALGAAIATSLIAIGARIMLFGPEQTILEAIRAKLGEQCRFVAGSLTDEDALELTAAVAAEAWGQIDALVSLPPAPPPSAFADRVETFSQTVEAAVGAAFIANKTLGAHLQRSGGGAIVNIASSTTGQSQTGEETSAAAIVMMTRSLACEWGGYGIRVNAVTGAPASPPVEDDPVLVLADTIPDSVTDLSGVAETVLFLLSGASSYVTGAAFVVGRSAGS